MITERNGRSVVTTMRNTNKTLLPPVVPSKVAIKVAIAKYKRGESLDQFTENSYLY